MPPWKIDELKDMLDRHVLPLLKDEDYRYRLYGIFLLGHMKHRELVMSHEIWEVLESLPDYERLYITYTFQDLHLNKLGFIDKGMKLIEQSIYQKYGKEILYHGLNMQKCSLQIMNRLNKLNIMLQHPFIFI